MVRKGTLVLFQILVESLQHFISKGNVNQSRWTLLSGSGDWVHKSRLFTKKLPHNIDKISNRETNCNTEKCAVLPVLISLNLRLRYTEIGKASSFRLGVCLFVWHKWPINKGQWGGSAGKDLLPSLITCVQSQELTWWKERTSPQKLSSDHHTHCDISMPPPNTK